MEGYMDSSHFSQVRRRKRWKRATAKRDYCPEFCTERADHQPWKGVRDLAHGMSRGFASNQESQPRPGRKTPITRLPSYRFLSPLPG
jgi:hypothetical protein